MGAAAQLEEVSFEVCVPVRQRRPCRIPDKGSLDAWSFQKDLEGTLIRVSYRGLPIGDIEGVNVAYADAFNEAYRLVANHLEPFDAIVYPEYTGAHREFDLRIGVTVHVPKDVAEAVNALL